MKTKFIIIVYIHMIRMCIIVDRHKGELLNLTAAGFNEAENWRRSARTIKIGALPASANTSAQADQKASVAILGSSHRT